MIKFKNLSNEVPYLVFKDIYDRLVEEGVISKDNPTASKAN